MKESSHSVCMFGDSARIAVERDESGRITAVLPLVGSERARKFVLAAQTRLAAGKPLAEQYHNALALADLLRTLIDIEMSND